MGEFSLPPEEFWRSTPRLFGAIAEAKVRRGEQELDRLVSVGYMTAALQRMKKLPKMRDVLPSASKTKKKTTPQSWQQMLSVAQQWDTISG